MHRFDGLITGYQADVNVNEKTSSEGIYWDFGRVVDGMEVADQIVNSPRDSRDNPNDKIDMVVALK